MEIDKTELKRLYTLSLQYIFYTITDPIRVSKIKPEAFQEIKEKEKLIKALTGMLATTWGSLNEDEKDYYEGITLSLGEKVMPHLKGLKGIKLRLKFLPFSLKEKRDLFSYYAELVLFLMKNILSLKKESKYSSN